MKFPAAEQRGIKFGTLLLHVASGGELTPFPLVLPKRYARRD